MLNRNPKYFIVIIVNVILLSILLLLWTDKLEITINDGVRFWEVLQILWVNFLALFSINIVFYVFKRTILQIGVSRVIITVLITFLFSSNLYFKYVNSFIKNRFDNIVIRKSLAMKIAKLDRNFNGNKGVGLNIVEYNFIKRSLPNVNLPSQALNINYAFQPVEFNGDYLFSLVYDIPKTTPIDTFTFNKSSFSKSQTFEILDSFKRVNYQQQQQ